MTPDPIALAALQSDWPQWARPPQVPPETLWKSWGVCSGRGWGKTRSCAAATVAAILSGRAKRVAFASFNLSETEQTMIHGVSGLIACSPPWDKPVLLKGQLVWRSGAIATPYTPEVPNGPRGPESDWLWTSEVSSYPPSTRDEFMSNLKLGNRLPGARHIWDTTPKRRNPLVRALLERTVVDPVKHLVVRGTSHANADNLDVGFVSAMEAELGDTNKSKEELLGLFLDDSDGSLWKQEWIDRARRDMPSVLVRRVISLDPAVSSRRGSDRSGIVDLGLGVDGQCCVIDDLTGRYAPEVWGALVIDRYMRGECDSVVVERNRGGDLVLSNLKACAAKRGIRVEKVEKDAPTHHHASTVNVRELTSRQGKDVRAEPIATAYEQGRVSHVRGANLTELEEVMCTWVPEHGGASPDAMDALVHGVSELLGLARATRPDRSAQIHGAAAMQASLAAPPREAPRIDISRLLGGGSGGGRI